MENNFNLRDKFYRVWIDNNKVYGEVYIVSEITDLYYIAIDRKNLTHKFRKNNDSLIIDKNIAINKYYELLDKINYHLSIGDCFTALLDGDKISYKIMPIFKNYEPSWTGATSRHGKRYKYKENTNYSSSPNNGTLSEDSPLAKAVLNKKIGDSFSYSVDKIKYSGIILDINRD